MAVSTRALSCTIFSPSVLFTSQSGLCGVLPPALSAGAQGALEGAQGAQAQQPGQGHGGALQGTLLASDISLTMAHCVLFRLFFNILELHLKPIRLVQHHLSLLQLHCTLPHYSSECSLKLCIALKSQLSAFVCLDLQLGCLLM